MILSIIIPVYNERETLATVIDRVWAVDLSSWGFEKELVVVDDCSQDGTVEIARELSEQGLIRLIRHSVNQGKGAALQSGFANARGEVILI